MSKLTKAAVAGAINDWAVLQAKIQKAAEAKAAELAPIAEKHDKKIAKLTDEADALEATVIGFLETQNKDQSIATDLAVAEQKTETKIGSRVIDVQAFMKAAKSKGAAMYDCISVAVAKAEKLLGKTEVDKIAEKKETTVVTRTLRLN